MKKIFLICAIAIVTIAAKAQTKTDEVAKFNSPNIDLGKIKQNEPTTATFTVTNISSKPLIIEQANSTCGCTVADYTTAPIAPGEKGFIKATYNAANTGSFYKTLTVKFAGVNETQAITLNGEVIAPGKE